MTRHDMDTILWGVNPDEWENLSDSFIIRRALSHGGVFLIGKMLNTYGEKRVKEEFTQMRQTSMPSRKYAYLKNYMLA